MIWIILLCFFLFLYVLYYISRDDFVIVRRDIQMEKIFNMAFLSGVVVLFFSRLLFMLFNSASSILNPLNFFALPYFPGFSLTGGIVSGILFIYFYSTNKKMPVGKILDLFTMSFIGVLPVGYFLTYIVSLGKTSLFFNFLFMFSIVFFVVFRYIFYPFSQKGEIKDGSFSLIFLSLFSFLYFLTKMFLNIKTFSFLGPENLMLLVLLFSSLILLLNQEIINKFLDKK